MTVEVRKNKREQYVHIFWPLSGVQTCGIVLFASRRIADRAAVIISVPDAGEVILVNRRRWVLKYASSGHSNWNTYRIESMRRRVKKRWSNEQLPRYWNTEISPLFIHWIYVDAAFHGQDAFREVLTLLLEINWRRLPNEEGFWDTVHSRSSASTYSKHDAILKKNSCSGNSVHAFIYLVRYLHYLAT